MRVSRPGAHLQRWVSLWSSHCPVLHAELHIVCCADHEYFKPSYLFYYVLISFRLIGVLEALLCFPSQYSYIFILRLPSDVDWAMRLEVIVQGRLVWAWVVSSALWICSPSYHQTVYTTCVTWPLPSATWLPKSPHAYLQSPTLFPLHCSFLNPLDLERWQGHGALNLTKVSLETRGCLAMVSVRQ